jgi:hypothetical protein
MGIASYFNKATPADFNTILQDIKIQLEAEQRFEFTLV